MKNFLAMFGAMSLAVVLVVGAVTVALRLVYWSLPF